MSLVNRAVVCNNQKYYIPSIYTSKSCEDVHGSGIGIAGVEGIEKHEKD